MAAAAPSGYSFEVVYEGFACEGYELEPDAPLIAGLLDAAERTTRPPAAAVRVDRDDRRAQLPALRRHAGGLLRPRRRARARRRRARPRAIRDTDRSGDRPVHRRLVRTGLDCAARDGETFGRRRDMKWLGAAAAAFALALVVTAPPAGAAQRDSARLDVYTGVVGVDQLGAIRALGIDRHELDISCRARGEGHRAGRDDHQRRAGRRAQAATASSWRRRRSTAAPSPSARRSWLPTATRCSASTADPAA